MSLDNLVTGAVIRYPFLWAAQAGRGETEGRKPRPTVVGFRIDNEILLLFPLTTKEPEQSRACIEVPQIHRHSAGLDRGRRCWIILDEINEDRLHASAYIEPDSVIGRFDRAFMLQAIERFLECRRRIKIRSTARFD